MSSLWPFVDLVFGAELVPFLFVFCFRLLQFSAFGLCSYADCGVMCIARRRVFVLYDPAACLEESEPVLASPTLSGKAPFIWQAASHCVCP